MQIKEFEWNILSHRTRLGKIESEVLDTIIVESSGNAYTLWKKSGLSHYPTVLRALKKLERKGIVEVVSKGSIRGEKLYAVTLWGSLVSFILKGDKEKIIEILKNNSNKFRELLKFKSRFFDRRVSILLRSISMHVEQNKKQPNINKIIEEDILDELRDTVLNVEDKESRDEVMTLAKVDWVRKLAIEVIEDTIDWHKQHTNELAKLKESLTSSSLS